MSDEQFAKFLKQIEDLRAKVYNRSDSFDSKINRLTNTLDNFAKRRGNR
jgi:hypothetical protein